MEDPGGDPNGSLGAFDRYANGLHSYAYALLKDPDAAADATVDALLVASASEGALTDRTRVRPWLYALVRNEALRRCGPEGRLSPAAEATELAVVHRLSPADVATVLGHPAEDAERFATAIVHTPGALGPLPSPGQDGPEADAAWSGRLALAAERRREVVRRARPFDHDGFPIPLDRRRLSGHALVWSAAAVVAIALGLLFAVPGRAALGGTGHTPSLAAALPVDDAPADVALPAPTLSATGLAAPGVPVASSTGTRPPAAPDRGAGRRDVPAPATPKVPVGVTPDGGVAPAGERTAPTTLTVEWASTDSYACVRRWAATVTARPAGARAAAVTLVQASWSDGGRRRTVTLGRSGADWTGTLTELPLGQDVSVTVHGSTADGVPVQPTRAVLTYSC